MSSYVSQNVHRTMKVLASISSALSTFSMGVYQTPKLGVFCYFPKYSILVAILSQLVKKLHQWSLYEVIEDILPFVLNTKPPLSDIWLLRYKQNRFGCFRKNSEFHFFHKTPKTVLPITQQPNIAQRPFCIKNKRENIIYHLT